MAEVLSQEEIDALLNNISTEKAKEEEEEKGIGKGNVYLYDFRHPNRVSKDQLRMLHTIHENFARMLATYLTTLLRTMVDVQVLSIDQVTFLEFTMAMSNPGCIWIFDLENWEGSGILEMDPSLILLTIERLFGGEGKYSEEKRGLSVIEQNVSGKIIERFMRIYDEAWTKALPMETKLSGFEMNPQFAQIAPASETTVVHFLEVSVNNTTFPMNICFPHFVMDPILQRLTTERWLARPVSSESDDSQRMIKHSLKSSDVDVHVQLGQTRLTLKEILELQENDVILLDTEIDDPLKVIIGNRERFLGVAGMSDNKLAVQILDSVAEDVPDESESGL